MIFNDVGAMPELPEVETVRAALAPVMTGGVIRKPEIRRPDLRFALPPDLQSFFNRCANCICKAACQDHPYWLTSKGDDATSGHVRVCANLRS